MSVRCSQSYIDVVALASVFKKRLISVQHCHALALSQYFALLYHLLCHNNPVHL